MDRDRGERSRFSDRDRDRDRYPPLRDDTYRPDLPRDPYRRRSPPPAGDSYIPPTSSRARPRSRSPLPLRGGAGDSYRRRSRSPRDDRYRERDDTYRGSGFRDRSRDRARSPPPRRAYEGRREDDRYRDDDRYRARSPVRGGERYVPRERERSPPVKRTRELSPSPRRRSPAKVSPTDRDSGYDDDRYRPRSRSPRRSPSPFRASNPQSGATSRRSSPPMHPSRLRQVQTEDFSPRGDSSYNNTAQSPYNANSPNRDSPYHPASNGIPPRGPANRAAPRAPPSGPASSRNFSTPQMSPPNGPSSVATAPISAHSRVMHNPVIGAPSRPRGGFGGPGFQPRGGYGGGFGRGGGYQSDLRRTSEVYHNPAARTYSNPSVPIAPLGPRASLSSSNGLPPSIPTGPSGGAYRGGPPPSGPSGSGYGSQGNGSSQTLPRSQRFLQDLPTLVPGGRKMNIPSLPNVAKVRRLEEEAERLRKIIEEKERAKRAALREWESLERESETARLRTELAEQSLRTIESASID